MRRQKMKNKKTILLLEVFISKRTRIMACEGVHDVIVSIMFVYVILFYLPIAQWSYYLRF